MMRYFLAVVMLSVSTEITLLASQVVSGTQPTAHDTSGCREDLERAQARLAYLKELVSSPDSDHAASRRDLGIGKMNPRKVTLVTRQHDCRKAVNALNSVRQEPGTVRQIWLYALGGQGYAVDDPGLDVGFSDKVLYFFGPKFRYKVTYSGF